MPFFVATFVMAWACWLVVIAAQAGWLPIPPSSSPLWIELGLFSPMLTAVALTVRGPGLGGTVGLLRQIGRWRVHPCWWATALLAPAAIRFAAIGAWVALGGQFPHLTNADRWLSVATSLPLVLLLGGPMGEEVGWRGYALPRLQGRLGPLPASLVIGGLTATWHLPLFFITVMPQSHLPLAVFFVRTVALAILSTWIYNGSRGSLLMVLLFHTAINSWPNALSIVTTDGSLVPYLLTSTGYCALAALLVITRRLSAAPAVTQRLAA